MLTFEQLKILWRKRLGIGTCKDCVFWEWQEGTVGECGAIPDLMSSDENTIAYVDGTVYTERPLTTTENFGCILYKADQ